MKLALSRVSIAVAAAERKWTEATRESLYKDNVSADALRHSSEALHCFWKKLHSAEIKDLEEGKLP